MSRAGGSGMLFTRLSPSPTTTLQVETARSGRAKCQACKELIEAGELRLGVEVEHEDYRAWNKWRHWCAGGRTGFMIPKTSPRRWHPSMPRPPLQDLHHRPHGEQHRVLREPQRL